MDGTRKDSEGGSTGDVILGAIDFLASGTLFVLAPNTGTAQNFVRAAQHFGEAIGHAIDDDGDDRPAPAQRAEKPIRDHFVKKDNPEKPVKAGDKGNAAKPVQPNDKGKPAKPVKPADEKDKPKPLSPGKTGDARPDVDGPGAGQPSDSQGMPDDDFECRPKNKTRPALTKEKVVAAFERARNGTSGGGPASCHPEAVNPNPESSLPTEGDGGPGQPACQRSQGEDDQCETGFMKDAGAAQRCGRQGTSCRGDEARGPCDDLGVRRLGGGPIGSAQARCQQLLAGPQGAAVQCGF